MGVDFMVKDYCIWVGSVFVLDLLCGCMLVNVIEVCWQVVEVIVVVVKCLGNMLVVCCKCYVYLVVVDVFLVGELEVLFLICVCKGL